MLEFLQDHLDAAGGRAEAAAQRSRERSMAIRGRIRAAVGVLPLDTDLAKLVGIVIRRMGDQPADAGTIRDELLAMGAKIVRVSEPKPQSARDSVTAT